MLPATSSNASCLKNCWFKMLVDDVAGNVSLTLASHS